MASERLNDDRVDRARIDRPSERGLLDQCWQECVADLMKFVIGLGVKKHAAEDVLQEVFLTAMSKAPVGIGGNDLRRWLFRVTANQCRQNHRKRNSWKRLLERLASTKNLPSAHSNDVASPPSQLTCEAERNATINAALDSLSKTRRAVLVLRYFNDFDTAEIGSILNMPDASVRSHLHRGRLELAQLLGDLHGDH